MRYQEESLTKRISLLALDARRTPFRSNSIPILTTFLGLPNINNPVPLMKELRRIVAGKFFAVHHFYSEDDKENKKALIKAGLEIFSFEKSTLQQFMNNGWQVSLKNICFSKVEPTPSSLLIEDFKIDSFPVKETTLKWATLEAI